MTLDEFKKKLRGKGFTKLDICRLFGIYPPFSDSREDVIRKAWEKYTKEQASG